MTVASPPKLPPGATVPIDPRELVGVSPRERGRAYNRAHLDAGQRRAVEQGLRLVEVGQYPPSRAAAVEHLRREREAHEVFAKPRRHR